MGDIQSRRVRAAIVEAVAKREGIEPVDLDYALQEYVETDAIELLVRHDSDSWALSFDVAGHAVTVTGGGEISIDGESVFDDPTAFDGELAFEGERAD